jgi:hypothetical protein
MSTDASRNLLYFVTGLIVFVRAYQLVRLDWSRPLRHGPGFFMAFEVAPGFYSGAGSGWLGRYRGVLLGEYTIELIALATVVVSGHWQWLPAWAGGVAVLYVASLSLFGAAAGRALGGVRTQPAVAVSLEARRLGDFFSWPAEGLMVATLAAGWFLLLVNGDAAVRWGAPAVATYVVLALFAAKIVHARAGVPLPVDRTGEHQQYFRAGRRQALRVIDYTRWFFVFVFAAYAVLHGWAGVQEFNWLRWLLVVVGIGIWLTMVVTTIAGVRRLDAMGRSLRPPASWAGPFRTSPWASRGGGIWAVSFVAGLALLFAILGTG